MGTLETLSLREGLAARRWEGEGYEVGGVPALRRAL
jgi:hypothetical protein